MATIHANIPDDLKRELEADAKAHHRTLSEVIRLRLSQPTPAYVLPTEHEAAEEFEAAAMESWNEEPWNDG